MNECLMINVLKQTYYLFDFTHSLHAFDCCFRGSKLIGWLDVCSAPLLSLYYYALRCFLHAKLAAAISGDAIFSTSVSIVIAMTITGAITRRLLREIQHKRGNTHVCEAITCKGNMMIIRRKYEKFEGAKF